MAHKNCAPAREECNKCDPTATPCFLLAKHNDLLLGSSSNIFAVPVSILWVGLQKK